MVNTRISALIFTSSHHNSHICLTFSYVSMEVFFGGFHFFNSLEAKGPVILELPVDKIRRPLLRTRSNDPEKVKVSEKLAFKFRWDERLNGSFCFKTQSSF